MDQAEVICERLGELGELRVYRRPGPPEHVAVEILRESDGRAWTLRVPWSLRAELLRIVAAAQERLADAEPPTFDEQGCAELARGLLASGDEILAILLQQDTERAFAVWRRELTRHGWSWTLDVVVAPEGLARQLCERVLAGIERLDRGAGSRSPASAPPIMTSPPGAGAADTASR